MNFINDTWRGLIDRRLWPVAVLLIVAAIGILVVFKHSASPNTQATVPSASVANTGGASPAVAAVALGQSTTQPDPATVFGPPNNPFAPTVGVKSATASASSASTVTPSSSQTQTSTGTNTGSNSSSSNSSSGNSNSTTNNTGTSAARYDLVLRWGLAIGRQPKTEQIRPLTLLQSSVRTVLVYLDTSSDHSRAVFYVDSSAAPSGKGRCHPSLALCETLSLKAGQSEILRVVIDGVLTPYRLTLLKIVKVSSNMGFTG